MHKAGRDVLRCVRGGCVGPAQEQVLLAQFSPAQPRVSGSRLGAAAEEEQQNPGMGVCVTSGAAPPEVWGTSVRVEIVGGP